MKKHLLLLPISLLITSNSYAQSYIADNLSTAPTVNIGGFVNANAGFRKEDAAFKQDRLPDSQFNTGTGTYNKMTNNPDFTNEAEIHVKVAGINEFGIKYGAIVELEANTSTSARNEGFNADKAFLFTESKVGKLELGNNSAVNQRMRVGPETFARGAGGINGKYLEYINLPMLADSTQVVNGGGTAIGNCNGYRVEANGSITSNPGSDCNRVKLPRFILIPQSPIAHGGYAKGFYNRASDNEYSNSSEATNFGFNKNSSAIKDGSFGTLADASKVNYYTPRIGGWQIGVSFAPDTGSNGTSASISGNNSGDIKQAISYGINYSDNLGNLGLALSATGESGKFEQNYNASTKRNNLKSYDAGVMATYFGFTIGASYGNWGDSLQPKSGIYSCDYNNALTIANQDCAGKDEKKFSNAKYYTAGAAYQFGPFATSLTYLNSEFQANQYQTTSLGVDYKMAKGLMPYAEITKYKFESNQPKASNVSESSTSSNSTRQLKDNSGYVALVGVLLSF